MPADVLRYEEVEELHAPEMYERKFRLFREAWERRLPEFPCPLKFQNGKLYLRSSQSEEAWIEDEKHWVEPRWIWREIEAEASSPQDVPWPPEPPGIRAVMFVQDEDGNHRTKALNTAEHKCDSRTRKRLGQKK